MARPDKILFFGAVTLAFIAVARATPDSDMDIIDQMSRNEEVAHRLKQAIKAAKQIENGPLQETVKNNFLNSLYLMANASHIVGVNASRAAGTIIRGFVQDSFNLGSLGAYMPRLIFLDGPAQFIEILRLVRTNQIRIPTDLDSAMDTLINFATEARNSQIAGNLETSFLSFFPNVFRGSERLAGDVLFNVFSWLSPLNPSDISLGAAMAFENRWDSKSSTTGRTVIGRFE